MNHSAFPARGPVPALLLMVFAGILSLSPAMATTESFYHDRIDDPRAVYLSEPEFGTKGDGITDDTDALQKAINAVVERNGQGILFVQPGTYLISKTLKVWPGVRVIGYGPERPRLLLEANAPGFQTGINYMVWFTGNVPGQRGHSGFRFLQPVDAPPQTIDFDAGAINDANPGTFYSALSNIDMAIGAGNPGAACVRAHYAQHCFLAHMLFQIGSGMAGIYDGGNFGEDLQFVGGKCAIITHKTAPSWQFTLVDCQFSGQTEAAIETEQAGLTLVRPHFKDVPTAISINPGMEEELRIKDGWMENISGPALIISNENNARTQINLEGVRCKNVPVFAQFRESGKQLAGKSDIYIVKRFFHGLEMSLPSQKQGITTQFVGWAQKQIVDSIPTDIPTLPPVSQWTNVHDLGVKGDGVTDDTAALRKAVAAHRVLYFPCGAYLLSDTIRLQPDSVLIGLHPSATRFYLVDKTPAFAGDGDIVPLIEAPPGGNAIVTGLGIETGAINPRAVGLLWKSGEHSLVNDVRFLGGHGTSQLSGAGLPVYNKDHSGDPDPTRKWNVQHASLCIAGGGGTFMDIWTPNTFAKSGLLVCNTDTPGRIYELSSEHHVDNEIIFYNVENWQMYGLQTEEERGESGHCLPLKITNCKNLTFANTFSYRVVSSDHPAPAAIKVESSKNIRFFNSHCYSDSRVSFDNLLLGDNGIQVRQREIGALNYSVSDEPADSTLAHPVAIKGGPAQKIMGGFNRISSLAIDAQGRVYFIDVPAQKVFRYDPAAKVTELISDGIPQPVNLVLDRAGNLLVISYADKVYSFDPKQLDVNHSKPPDVFTELTPQPTAPQPNADVVMPRDIWRNENDFVKFLTEPRPQEITSPDGSTVVPLENDFIAGHLYYGAKMHELLRAFGLQKAAPGQKIYVTDSCEEKTYMTTVNADGTRTAPQLFVEDGGESVATDAAGNVYIASGNINAYDPTGKLQGTIDVPERPLALAFAPDGTLYIAAGTSLYRWTPAAAK